jgi:YD repeat-containing protein
MNTSMKLTCNIALVAFMAGGASTAFANGAQHHNGGVIVTDVAATVTQYNYNARGEVTGILVSNTAANTTSLLSFPSVCGGVTSIAAPGAPVTYSGRVKQSSEPVSLVKVTAFTPALVLDTTTRTAYPDTSGTVDRLNYNAGGDPNGFFFLPDGGTPKLVITGTDGFDLGITITPGTHLSVTGFTEVSSCGPAALTVIYATDLNGTRIHSCGHDDHDGD